MDHDSRPAYQEAQHHRCYGIRSAGLDLVNWNKEPTIRPVCRLLSVKCRIRNNEILPENEQNRSNNWIFVPMTQLPSVVIG